MSSKRDSGGFTLIELMIVVVVVALLAAIALPSFMNSIRKSRRAEAVASISAIEQAQERWRANNTTYAANSVLTTAAPNGLGQPATTENGRYSLALSGNNETGYVVTATAVTTGSQASDTQGSTSCATLTVTITNGNGVKAPAACWSQ
ncbi:MAG: type IV pilin protein [Pseudomonadota bacterium]